MVVNSFVFFAFFVVVFIIYYLPISRKNTKYQNVWLFLTSYFFYGYAEWKMIPLLLVSTITFYVIGLWLKSEMIKKNTKRSSYITTLGTVLGIGILLYFKYLNFFAESFSLFLTDLGFNVSWTTLNIVLPIGVSFFTFKLISYVIEIHREHIEPCKNFVDFGTYIAFFPTILSGPIDRPNKFIPQLKNIRSFNYCLSVDGCRQILWGMFTKMCIADNLGTTIDYVWNDYSSQSATALVVTALLYPIQVYADFDGYSNMAIGVGKVLGFHIERNFNHPFLARNIAEYWRKWHISLTGWLTDYIFSPLNIMFRDLQNMGVILAIIINFVIIGFWHGANWTFGFFGLYHGLLYIPLVISGSFARPKKLKANAYGFPKIADFLKMLLTFCFVALGLVLFRAPSLLDSYNYLISIIMLQNGFHIGPLGSMIISDIWIYVFAIVIMILEWTTRNHEYPLQFSSFGLFRFRIIRWTVYFLLCSLLFFFTNPGSSQDFIYFQF